MTDPVVRRLPPLPVYGSPPLDDARPFVMHDEGPITTDATTIPSLNHRWWYGGEWHDQPPQPAPPQPATAEQADRIIALLERISGQLARALGPGR